MGSYTGIPVMITSKEVVAPPLSRHHHPPMSRLPLSNLDYIFTQKLDVSVYFCYAKPTGSDHRAMVAVLRESLARTLSDFPVFAGEVVPNSDGEPESLLSGRGVDFLSASVDMELGELDLFHPDVTVGGTIVPQIHHGVLAVQVTAFKCGGLVLGITFDHIVADAYSANMFLLSWSENALNKQPLTFFPNLDRSLLRPTQPAAAASSPTGRWYMPVPRHEPPLDNGSHHDDHPDEQFTSRTFCVEAETIHSLHQNTRFKNGSEGGVRTSYVAFTAFLWQLLAKSTVSAATSFRMGIVVDCRTRLHDESSQNAALMPHYFGNAVSLPFTEATAGALRSMTLSEAANLLQLLKMETATPEHFHGLIKWAEERRPTVKPGIRLYTEEVEEGAALVVSSGQRFPVGEVEFGWGKAVFGSYYFPWGGRGGYVMPMPSATRKGDWVVFMHLRNKQMEVVEKLGGHVFRPLVSSYLNLPKSPTPA